MKNKIVKEGICAPCGEFKKLSFEHVPPKSAFNNKPLFVQTHGHPIKIKKHGRKAYSLFKFGLIFLAHALLNPLSINDLVNCIKILSCT